MKIDFFSSKEVMVRFPMKNVKIGFYRFVLCYHSESWLKTIVDAKVVFRGHWK